MVILPAQGLFRHRHHTAKTIAGWLIKDGGACGGVTSAWADRRRRSIGAGAVLQSCRNETGLLVLGVEPAVRRVALACARRHRSGSSTAVPSRALMICINNSRVNARGVKSALTVIPA